MVGQTSSSRSGGQPQPSSSATTGRGRLRVTLRALRHRDFRLFFGGQLISLIGTWMQAVAQPWLVYRLTGSSLMLGLVGFTSHVPIFMLSIVGGAVADRIDRHRMIISTQTCAMLLASILAFLTLFDFVQVWHIFLLSFLLGLVNAFDIPARQAFIVEMVGRDDLMNAIALNSSLVTGARVVGPAVAGVMVAGVGEGWCFFANAASYIAVITGLLLMKTRFSVRVRAQGSTFGNVVEGIRFIRRAVPVRALLLLLGLTSMLGMPYTVLMPIFADRILNAGARGLGILMGAAGVGSLVGALSLASRTALRGLERWVSACCAGFGLSLVLFSLSRTFWLSAALLLPAGFSMMVQLAASNTLVQAMVPDRLRGRVMAVHTMMFLGMAPFGAFFAGALAEKLGAPPTILIGGIGCIVGSAVFRSRLPSLRVEAYQLLSAQAAAAGSAPRGIGNIGNEA